MTPVHRAVSARLLAALLALPIVSAQGQFSNEVPVVRDGVRFLVRPSVTINTTPGGVVQVQLTQIHARIDESYGVVVDGVKEAYTAWTRGLVSHFNAVTVTSLSLGITFDEVQGCSGRVGFATWREGGQETLACNSGSRGRLTGFTVNGLSTTGLLELQAEVRRRRAADRREVEARAQRAREDSIARARQAAAARQAATQPAPVRTSPSTASTGSATVANATPSAPTPATAQASAEEAQRQAEAARRRAQAEEAQRAAAQTERQRQELNASMDQAATQFAGAVTGMVDAMAYNRRLDEARRQREAAALRERVARYRADALTRYANAPEAPLCTSIAAADHPRAEFGTPITGALTMQSCRTADGKNAAVHRVRVPARYWATIQLQAGVNGSVVLTGPDGKAITGQDEFWVNPGEYTVQLLTTMPGEIGNYSIAFKRTARSATGDWFWGVGFEQSSPSDGFVLDGGGATFLLRSGLRLGTVAELIVESAAGSGIVTGEVGGRAYLQGVLARSRLFAQGTYGYVSINRANDWGSFDTGSGTGITAGLGWEYTITSSKNNTPGTFELGVYQTSADLTGEFEAPFKSLRIRAVLNLHSYFK